MFTYISPTNNQLKKGNGMGQLKLHTARRRKQIVEVARKIIATNGMEALTIRELAKEVGISEGNIYNHFASKRDVLRLLIEDVEETLMEAVEKAVSEKQDPLERLENVLKSHLSYVEQKRGVSLLVISETLQCADKDLKKRMFDVVTSYMSRIEQLLAEAIESGQVSQSINRGAAALTFFALIHATVTLWALSDSSFSLASRHKLLWESYRASLASRDSRELASYECIRKS
jgi:AcrR family transcriptional regulator